VAATLAFPVAKPHEQAKISHIAKEEYNLLVSFHKHKQDHQQAHFQQQPFKLVYFQK
jgi:hypothetical protein